MIILRVRVISASFEIKVTTYDITSMQKASIWYLFVCII